MAAPAALVSSSAAIGACMRNPLEGDHDSGAKPITYSGAKPISDSSLKAISNRPRAEW
jgi:hypothetical protein